MKSSVAMSPRPGPVASTPAASSKRQALLDAALACFLEHGVMETTLDDVLARSGASVGSLYHHFGGKGGLADALYVDCLGEYQRAAGRRLDEAPDPRSGVHAVIEHHLRWIVDETDRARFVLAYRDHEIRAASAELRALNHTFYGQLERWLDAHATVPLPPLPAVISQWLGPAQDFSRHWLTGQVRATPADVRPFLCDSAWHALRPLFSPTPSLHRPKGV